MCNIIAHSQYFQSVSKNVVFRNSPFLLEYMLILYIFIPEHKQGVYV